MILYRRMTPEDVEAVHGIELASFPTPWTLDSFHYEMRENQFAYYIVAENEHGNIVGFCGMWLVIDSAQITNVAVIDAARGQGIGEGLMREAMRIAKEHGVDVMSLEVRVSNNVAQNLYRKLGFQDGGIRKGYYTDNQEDALVMWVNLNDDRIILAIETSCDETAAAIIRNGHEIISNVVSSQIESQKRFGGVVPEIASRHHVEQITIVIEETLEKANMRPSDLTAIAVTEGPGLVGALLIGINAAKAFAFAHNLPIIPVHHIAGHIYANALVQPMQFPLLALVVSGDIQN